MANFSFVLCGFVILYVVNCAQSHRIVGGSITTISKHKHQVYLRKSGGFFCGGSLVKPRFVVTAAHCVKGVSKSVLTVHGNTSFLNERGESRRVDKVLLPEGYDAATHVMDIAVLKLSSPLTGVNVKAISLNTVTVPDNATVMVTGWGVTNETFENPPNQLRKATVRIVNKALCRQQYKPTNITKVMICASINGRKDTCQGDSGGPMVYKGKLAGVTSFGSGCARLNKPGIYTGTDVARVQNFLQKAFLM